MVGLHLLLTSVGNSGETGRSIDCSWLISKSIGVVAEILVEPKYRGYSSFWKTDFETPMKLISVDALGS